MKQEKCGVTTLAGGTFAAEQISSLVSVVIINYNGLRNLGKILDGCLDSVLKTVYPSFEVLFVDNASSDGSAEYVQRQFGTNGKLRIIRNEKNLGFAEGNNRGIKQAKGKFIALLNSDTRVTENWLTELVKAVHPSNVGAAQSKLLQMDKPTLLDCAGGLLDFYGYHFERGQGETPSRYNRGGEIFYAKGASVIFKREALSKAGLFDPEVFMYFDEVDLCWRIWLSGYKVVYSPASTVYHASGSTAAKMQSQERLYFYARNHLMVLLKNFGLMNAAKAVKVSLLFEVRNVGLLLARRKPLAGLAIIKAFCWNLRNMKQTWTKRQTVQNCIRQIPDTEVKVHMLTPCPPFPLYILFPRSRYEKTKID
jgi:GT2 family glycosyltransferase